jgi:membrane protein implicated in regulation of membrane protease activity
MFTRPVSARGRLAWMALAFAVPIAAVAALRGPQLLTALAGCPPQAALAAAGLHAATLFCRCEAWRVAVGAIADRRADRVEAHAAGGAGFAAGTVQGAGTAPARAVAFRRLAPAIAPPVGQAVVAEVPVLLLEALLAAIVLAVATAAVPLTPAWMPAAVGAASIGGLFATWALARRARGHRLGAGMRALSDGRRRLAIAALIVVVTALGLARMSILLQAFALPADPPSIAFAFVALGIFGLLPIGPASTPGALVAVFGGADAAGAAAAGIAVSATSFAGVALYGAGSLAALGIARRSTRPRRDQVEQQRRPAELPGRQALPVERVVVLAETVPLDDAEQRVDDPVGIRVVAEPAHRRDQEPGDVHPGRSAPAAKQMEAGTETRLVA